MAAALLVAVGAASAQSQRKIVTGHFRVPDASVGASIARASGNAIANSGFESGNVDGGWYQCGDVNAFVTNEHPFSGSYAEYSGTKNGVGEPRGNSGVCQRVTLPSGAMLSAHLYQLSSEGQTAYAYQEANLLDDRGSVILNLYKTANYKRQWVLGRWNLAAYAGRTVWLYFGVHGDGDPKLSTQQFVDDVVLTGS